MKTLDKKQFGSWALVTGASSGIGEGFAIELAKQGFNLVLIARNTVALESLSQKLQSQHHIKIKVLGLDLSDPGFMTKLAPLVEGLDLGLVVSNAGAGRPKAFLDLSLETIESHMQLNALSHARLAHFFGPKMVTRGRGGLLFVGAMGASEGIPYMANDAAAKAYLISLARSLNTELGGAGVHVSVVSPSAVETPVIAKLGFDGFKLPKKPASVQSFVDEALWAVAKNKNSRVSGRLFRFLSALLPKNAFTKMNGSMLKKASLVLQERGA